MSNLDYKSHEKYVYKQYLEDKDNFYPLILNILDEGKTFACLDFYLLKDLIGQNMSENPIFLRCVKIWILQNLEQNKLVNSLVFMFKQFVFITDNIRDGQAVKSGAVKCYPTIIGIFCIIVVKYLNNIRILIPLLPFLLVESIMFIHSAKVEPEKCHFIIDSIVLSVLKGLENCSAMSSEAHYNSLFQPILAVFTNGHLDSQYDIHCRITKIKMTKVKTEKDYGLVYTSHLNKINMLLLQGRNCIRSLYLCLNHWPGILCLLNDSKHRGIPTSLESLIETLILSSDLPLTSIFILELLAKLFHIPFPTIVESFESVEHIIEWKEKSASHTFEDWISSGFVAEELLNFYKSSSNQYMDTQKFILRIFIEKYHILTKLSHAILNYKGIGENTSYIFGKADNYDNSKHLTFNPKWSHQVPYKCLYLLGELCNMATYFYGYQCADPYIQASISILNTPKENDNAIVFLAYSYLQNNIHYLTCNLTNNANIGIQNVPYFTAWTTILAQNLLLKCRKPIKYINHVHSFELKHLPHIETRYIANHCPSNMKSLDDKQSALKNNNPKMTKYRRKSLTNLLSKITQLNRNKSFIAKKASNNKSQQSIDIINNSMTETHTGNLNLNQMSSRLADIEYNINYLQSILSVIATLPLPPIENSIIASLDNLLNIMLWEHHDEIYIFDDNQLLWCMDCFQRLFDVFNLFETKLNTKINDNKSDFTKDIPVTITDGKKGKLKRFSLQNFVHSNMVKSISRTRYLSLLPHTTHLSPDKPSYHNNNNSNSNLLLDNFRYRFYANIISHLTPFSELLDEVLGNNGSHPNYSTYNNIKDNTFNKIQAQFLIIGNLLTHRNEIDPSFEQYNQFLCEMLQKYNQIIQLNNINFSKLIISSLWFTFQRRPDCEPQSLQNLARDVYCTVIKYGSKEIQYYTLKYVAGLCNCIIQNGENIAVNKANFDFYWFFDLLNTEILLSENRFSQEKWFQETENEKQSVFEACYLAAQAMLTIIVDDVQLSKIFTTFHKQWLVRYSSNKNYKFPDWSLQDKQLYNLIITMLSKEKIFITIQQDIERDDNSNLLQSLMDVWHDSNLSECFVEKMEQRRIQSLLEYEVWSHHKNNLPIINLNNVLNNKNNNVSNNCWMCNKIIYPIIHGKNQTEFLFVNDVRKISLPIHIYQMIGSHKTGLQYLKKIFLATISTQPTNYLNTNFHTNMTKVISKIWDTTILLSCYLKNPSPYNVGENLYDKWISCLNTILFSTERVPITLQTTVFQCLSHLARFGDQAINIESNNLPVILKTDRINFYWESLVTLTPKITFESLPHPQKTDIAKNRAFRRQKHNFHNTSQCLRCSLFPHHETLRVEFNNIQKRVIRIVDERLANSLNFAISANKLNVIKKDHPNYLTLCLFCEILTIMGEGQYYYEAWILIHKIFSPLHMPSI